MPNSKDYSIYQELDLSLEQIKRELPKVAAALPNWKKFTRATSGSTGA